MRENAEANRKNRGVTAAFFLIALFLILAGAADLFFSRKQQPEPLFSLSEVARFDVASYEFTFELITAARLVERNVSLLILTGGLLGRDDKRVLLKFAINVRYGTSLLQEEGAEYAFSEGWIRVKLPGLRIVGQPEIEAEILDAINCDTAEMHQVRDEARKVVDQRLPELIEKFGLQRLARQWTGRVAAEVLSLPFPGRQVEVTFKEGG